MSEDTPLSQNIQNYHKAIQSEFALTETKDPIDLARTSLSQLLPEATKALEQILINGDSDTVRLSAVKLVFEHTLGKGTTMAQESELTRLVDTLTAKPTPTN